jgi:hypothetical protein
VPGQSASFAFPTLQRPGVDGEQRPPQEPAAKKPPEDSVLRGLKDLQQLQKQTLAVLEAVKGSLDGIQDVLRSPEATRGLEKQKNAATLLSRGFPRDAVEQAQSAAALLPANPETHLLLALSLAADQQMDAALQATRKGLALVDRRSHPLAIEAGLLHTLAALGMAGEAIDRWSAIIDGLPLPVLLEQTGCIAACFPASPEAAVEAGGGGATNDLLDGMLAGRLQQGAEAGDRGAGAPHGKARRRGSSRRQRLIDTAPMEIPASCLITALDASGEASLRKTRRAILRQIAYRLRGIASANEMVRFLTDCLVPLGNRGLDRATLSLARSAIRRMLQLHADAPTLHRAMVKLQMAGAETAAAEIANLLWRWRNAGSKVARAKAALVAGGGCFVGGLVMLLGPMSGIGGGRGLLIVSAALLGIGIVLGLFAGLMPTWDVPLPANRGPLTPDEIRFLRPMAMRTSLRDAMSAGQR